MYRYSAIEQIKGDFADTFAKSEHIDDDKIKWHFMRKFIRSVAKVFALLM